MTSYLTILNQAINKKTIGTRKFRWLRESKDDTPLLVARRFRRVMRKENHIRRMSLYIYKINRSYYVVRKISERELQDPLYGNRDRREKYRKYLVACDRRFKRKKGKRKITIGNGE